MIDSTTNYYRSKGIFDIIITQFLEVQMTSTSGFNNMSHFLKSRARVQLKARKHTHGHGKWV